LEKIIIEALHYNILNSMFAGYSICPENNYSNPPYPPFSKGGIGGITNFHDIKRQKSQSTTHRVERSIIPRMSENAVSCIFIVIHRLILNLIHKKEMSSKP
jgi:hypothetical protein